MPPGPLDPPPTTPPQSHRRAVLRDIPVQKPCDLLPSARRPDTSLSWQSPGQPSTSRSDSSSAGYRTPTALAANPRPRPDDPPGSGSAWDWTPRLPTGSSKPGVLSHPSALAKPLASQLMLPVPFPQKTRDECFALLGNKRLHLTNFACLNKVLKATALLVMNGSGPSRRLAFASLPHTPQTASSHEPEPSCARAGDWMTRVVPNLSKSRRPGSISCLPLHPPQKETALTPAAADTDGQLQETHGVNDAWNRFQPNYSPKDRRRKVRGERIQHFLIIY